MHSWFALATGVLDTGAVKNNSSRRRFDPAYDCQYRIRCHWKHIL